MSEIEDLKKKLAMACRMLFLAELVDYSGHISVRIPGTDRFLINPHPISRAEVKPEDILTSDLNGTRLEGKWNLPSELPMHTRTYRVREDVESIAHLHNRMVVVLSMADRPLIPASNTGAFFGPGPMPVYSDPALIHTNEQGDEVARTLGASDAAILRGHGSIVVGKSIEWTFAACVDLEESAARLYFASLLGPVRFYTDDEVNRVVKGRRRMPVAQKIWDHYVAKARLKGLMSGLL
ncbi:MAG: class II aldolase/adducin family protein [Deltaproteobacteria bacterium]|nr:class II aldolase/adducin family protein [Deltaproteobacteria bacterium]